MTSWNLLTAPHAFIISYSHPQQTLIQPRPHLLFVTNKHRDRLLISHEGAEVRMNCCFLHLVLLDPLPFEGERVFQAPELNRVIGRVLGASTNVMDSRARPS